MAAEKLKITRLLGGQRNYLGDYDTLGKFAKLGNPYGPGGGYSDSLLGGGMLEIETGVEFFVVRNPLQPASPIAVEPPIPHDSGGGDGGGGAGGDGGAGDGGAGGAGDGGGDGGGSADF